MKLSDIRKKLSRYPVLFVSLLVVPSAVVTWVMRKGRVEELYNEVEQLDRQWKQMLSNRDRAVGLEEQLERLQVGAELLQGRLMEDDQVAANYEFFYRLEAQAGVRLRNFAKGELGNGEEMLASHGRLQHFAAIPFTFSVEGEFNNLLQFVDLLRSQRYLIHLERLAVVAPRGSGDPSILTADLRCYVLARKP